jgi:hypothetical protein
VTTTTIPQQPFKFTQARLDALPFTDELYFVKDSEQRGLRCNGHPKGKKFPDGLKVLQVYAKPKGSPTPA